MRIERGNRVETCRAWAAVQLTLTRQGELTMQIPLNGQIDHENSRRLLQIDISNDGMVKNGSYRPPKVRAGGYKRKKKLGREEQEEEEEEEEEDPRSKRAKK